MSAEPIIHYRQFMGVRAVCGAAAPSEDLTLKRDRVTCRDCLAWLEAPFKRDQDRDGGGTARHS